MKLDFLKFNKKIYIALIAIAVVLGIYFFIKSKNGYGQNMAKPTPAVNVITIKSQDAEDFEEMPGRTSAYRFAEVRPQVDGIIIKRFFTEGSKVEQGDQLYQIDPAPYQATYNSAKADFQKATANLDAVRAKSDRFKKLIEVEAVSKQEFDDVKASLASAQAEVAITKAAMQKAKIYLDYTKVFAPISGRISKSLVTEGSLVSANQAQILTTITQLDPIYVDVSKASEELASFQNKIAGKDQVPVDLYLSDETLYNHQGTLQFSEVNVDPSTSSVGLRAIFDNPDQVLLPGSFVRARVKININNVILVPQKSAVRNPDGSLIVWLVGEKNKVKPQPIKVTKAIGNNWLVAEGLKDGDVIVVEGLQKIAPDAVVKPVFESTH